jgi:hypothetical protein
VPESDPLESKYRQIKIGMSAEEVEEILGKPQKQGVWTSERGVIMLTFEDGKVATKEYVPLPPIRRPRHTI